VYLTKKKKGRNFVLILRKEKKKNCISLWADFLLFLRKKKKKRRRGNFVMRRFRTVPEKKKMQFVFGEITVLEKRKEKKIKKSFRVFSRWVFVD
jgi:hypothetical protein